MPAVIVAGLMLAATGQAQPAPRDTDALPNFDRRATTVQPANSAMSSAPAPAAAASAALRASVRGVQLDRDPLFGTIAFLGSKDAFLTGPAGTESAAALAALQALPANDPHRRVKAFLDEYSALFGHGSAALSVARVSRDYVTAHNGLRTTVWQQQLGDIRVFEATFQAHVTGRGEIVNVASRLVPDLAAMTLRGAPTAPTITARVAVALAARNIGEDLAESGVTPQGAPDGAEARQRFSAAALTDTEARYVWLPMDTGTLRLCWEIICTGRTRSLMYRVLIDTDTGDIHVRHGLTEDISPASYRVFTSDSPTPMSPGHATPSSAQPPQVARALVTLPALNTTASPNGWIDDGIMETRGNNVDAHTDADANNQPDLPRPQATGSGRVFDPPLDLTQAPATYREAAVVNLFYWCNWVHDKLYEVGFTEAAGNFQNNNFGRGGVGSDAVQADAQDGSGTNNANFSTPPDGSPGRMQMYVWTGPNPDRDGDFDQEIVLHEYVHGLSNRLVGGGVGMSAMQSRGMGEGWSDFYALALLSEAGDNLAGNMASGGYSTMDYYYGIRRYPYSTNLLKNPLTFKDIDPAQASTHPGISRRFSGAANEVHNMGEVWCVTLWEVRANLITKHGFVVGNQLTLQLATDGMKLSPANPTFIQVRDAILQADRVATSGANRAELWAAFAKRGMGFSAWSPANSTTAGLIENFDLPDDLTISPIPPVAVSGQVGGPFSPTSGDFVLTNTGAAPVTWTAIKTGAWFTISQPGGTLAAGASTTVVASVNSAANSLIDGNYAGTITFTNTTSGATQTRAVRLEVEPVYQSILAEAFESGVLDSARWAVTGTTTYRTQITTANGPHGGTRHMVMDSSTNGTYARNEATMTIDLAGRTGVRLKFWAKIFGDEASGPPTSPFLNGADFDGVAISADGTNWYEVQGLRTTATPAVSDTWTRFVVDLDPLLAARGLNFNSTFKIRFNQYDNFSVPTDGIAIDDIEVLRIVGAAAPTISVPPASRTANVGDTVNFSVTATSVPSPVYQWKFNGNPIAGATLPQLTLTNVQLAHAGSYTVTVTNGFGSVTSTAATLSGTVPAPEITSQPGNVATIAGREATLSVEASGSGTIVYQWRRNGMPIPGATGSSYTITAASRTDADYYDVVVSAGLSFTVSTVVRLTVEPVAYAQSVAVGSIPRVVFEADSAVVYRVLPLADGRVYVAGEFVSANNVSRARIVRLNADGTVDTTFFSPGFNALVNAMAVQGDGKLIVGGGFTQVGGVTRNFLARLNVDGTLDTTFATGGVSSTVYAVSTQPDGKILVGGAFSSYFDASFVSTTRGRLARLNSDGTLDGAFNPAPSSTVYALDLQSDGKILLGGAFTTVATQSRVRLARINADGTLDASFTPGTGFNSTVRAVKVQTDGKVVVGGYFTTFNAATANRIVRLDSAGSIDATFVTGSGFDSDVNDFALQADGKIVVGGWLSAYNGTSRYGVARLNVNGSLDTTYNPSPNSTVYSVAFDPSARLLVGGAFSSVGSASRSRVARVNASGQLDPDFAPVLRSAGTINAAVLLPGGKVLAGGYFTHANGMALPTRNLIRFNGDGSIDPTFNPGSGPNSYVNVMLLQPNGKVVIGGSFGSVNGASRFRLARISADGVIDEAFPAANSGPNNTVSALAAAPGGRLLIGGYFTTYNGIIRNRLARLFADGSLDLTFDPGAGPDNSGFPWIYALAVAPDGKVNVGGSFVTVAGQPRAYLARLNADGTLDANFENPALNSVVKALALQPDGKLLVGGYFSGTGYQYFTRFNSGGIRDTGYPNSAALPSSSVESMVLQEDGKVILAGAFGNVGGVANTAYLARIGTGGTVDTTFSAANIGGGVNTVLVRDSGQLFVGGSGNTGAAFTNAASGTAPVFTQLPANRSVVVGTGVTFTAAATGSPTPVFQWYLNGAPLAGATATSYAIASATIAHAGSYTVTASNTAGSVMSPPAGLAVTAVVGAPTITDIANQTIDEDRINGTGDLSFVVGDAETPAANLVVTGASSNTTLVPNANITFGGSGANRSIKVIPALNQNGIATITVTVSDGTLTASDTFLLTVNAVNDAPTISDIANQTILSGATTGALAFTVGDVETAATSLTVTGSSSNTTLVPNANVVFGGSGANRTVTVTPASGQTGTATISVMVSDGALTTTDTFLLTVNSASVPVITLQPMGQAVIAGGTAAFSAAATNPLTGTMTYRWYFTPVGAGTPQALNDLTGRLAGTQTATLAVSSIQASDAGDYVCVVTNSAGFTTSNSAPLVVAARVVRIVNQTAAPGAQVAVPVQLLANGNENALGFSVNFNTALLTFVSADRGAQASDATMNTNSSLAASGRIGVALAKPTGVVWSAGTQEIVKLTFTLSGTAANGTVSTLTFGDVPIAREIVSGLVEVLPGGYQGGVVTVASGYEADMNASGAVTIADWVRVGRIVAGLDARPTGVDFLKADCSPRMTSGVLTLGGGTLTIADWVQAGRYAAGLDPLTEVGGPSDSTP